MKPYYDDPKSGITIYNAEGWSGPASRAASAGAHGWSPIAPR